MRMLQFLVIAGLALGGAARGRDAEGQDSGPSQLIGSVAEAMLQALDAAPNTAGIPQDRSAGGRGHAAALRSQYAARLVLGRHWTTASADQRARFVEAFYHSMLRNYGSALVDFTPDRLKVLPYQGSADAPSATVRTQVRKNDGTTVAVNYSLRRTPEGWKAWDVVIEGVSYVKSFRDDFGSEIAQRGLDAVIHRLEKQTGAGRQGLKPGAC
jgi:phospholipid transport system substrate-binding protein